MTRDNRMAMGLTTTFVAREMRARGYEVHEGRDVLVTGGAADSRAVRAGELFTAFPGEHHDGNEFVAAALANGAAAVICERLPEGDWQDRTIVVAPDATRAVGELAHAWRTACAPRVVGITGTVGKTTAKELTAGILAAHFRTHRSEGNFNSREGLPLALLSLRAGHEVSVLEIGMDSKGEIAYLCSIAEPEIGIVLNIGLTHISKLGSIEAIAEEKLTLGRYAAQRGTAVVNIDDPRIAAEFTAPGFDGCALTFGTSKAAALRWGNVTNHGLDGTAFEVSYQGTTVRANCPLPGEHVLPGAVAALGAALALGLGLAEACDALARVETRGRSRTLRGKAGSTIIDDRYNSSPASLAGALRMLAALPGRRIALLGRMAELGDYEEEEHRRAGALAGECCDILIAVGPTCETLAESASHTGLTDVRWFKTKEEAATDLSGLLRSGDTVLVKASRGEAFETVLPVLEAEE